MLRTHTCNELTEKNFGETVTLCGWVDTRRDHGNLIFVDLRDRWGRTQLVFDSEKNNSVHAEAEKLRSEFVLKVRGTVEKRPQGTVNPKLPTGAIEVKVLELEILNSSETPAFEISDTVDVAEDIRLKYRYLDLRRPSMLNRLIDRNRIVKIARDFLDECKFVEVETPMLTRSTPEGARDFLVPARLMPGHFYALPQSPQLFKQILMVSGLDRYYQLARCLRDEDLRADRQPEHTQIDMEMSFITEEDIFSVIEGLMGRIVKAISGVEIKTPFLRMSYDEAMNRFGSDKPDLRFELELVDVTAFAQTSGIRIFQDAIQKGGVVKGLKAFGKDFSRSELDELTVFAQQLGAKGLASLKVAEENKLEGPIAKFFTPEQQKELIEKFTAKKGDTIFLIADEWVKTCTILGALRLTLAKQLNLVQKSAEPKLLWVVDFPLFAWNEEEKRLDAMHHPFTSPREADLPLLETEPLKAKARAYDLVMNGTEVGGGSIRIHREDVQKKIFQALGITKDEAEEKFGFLLRAFRFGAPPHGGIAIGLDRLCAMLLGVDSIRDVIAFPKTQKGTCLLTDAPGKVYPKQLKELNIQLKT
jgi:aspartyl-tRNA synthetase